MKLTLLSAFLALPLIFGCATATAPTPPVAPGYTSAADQTLGESLAAVNAFVGQEKINYAAETPAQQATEKPYLNSLITATNLANAAYQSFHAGTQTLAQAQTAYASAKTAQDQLAAANGVH